MRISDWSSDVCSSDLRLAPGIPLAAFVRAPVDTRLAALHASLAPASASGSDCPADWPQRQASRRAVAGRRRRSTGLRSEEHTSELQSLLRSSYAVFYLKKNIITHP